MEQKKSNSIIVSKKILYDDLFLPEEAMTSLVSTQEVVFKKVAYKSTEDVEAFKSAFASYDLPEEAKAIVFINSIGSRKVDLSLEKQNNLMFQIDRYMRPQSIQKLSAKKSSASCVFALS